MQSEEKVHSTHNSIPSIIAEYTLYLLQCFNDFDVPITMTAEEVRELLVKFEEDYGK